MSELDLPQICVRCHQLKLASLGKFFWSRARYHKRNFVCLACLDQPKILRLARPGEETPVELEVRRALEGLRFKAYAEFKLSRYIFDFAIPKLRMLIEVDSTTYHRHWKSQRRDSAKDAWAKKNHWHIVRIRAPELASQVVHAAMKRAQELR